MHKKATSFCHAGTIGDVWASLPAVKECVRVSGIPAEFYLNKDIPAEYYKGAVHPTKDESGKQVRLNQKMIDMIIPLLEAQPYIGKADTHDGIMKVDVDLNRVNETFVNMPNHPLSYWYFYVYPDLFCNVSLPYIFTPETDKDFGVKDKIIIARTERYHNMQNQIDYSFLKEWEDECVFSGTMREYNNFCMTFDLNMPLLIVNDFLELAQALEQANGLIANQTQIFQIAEGLKTPRSVELCSIAPNVIVQGEGGFEFYSQIGLEMSFHTMRGKRDWFFKEGVKKFQPTIKQAEINPKTEPQLSVDR